MVPPGILAMSLPAFGDESFAVMRDYNKMLVAGCLVEDTGERTASRSTSSAKPRCATTSTTATSPTSSAAPRSPPRSCSPPARARCCCPSTGSLRSRRPTRFASCSRRRFPKIRVECLTVHAMGTCRMGVEHASSSVVQPSGETWDVPGLFVADASVFPTPIGVNPQISIMALATRTRPAHPRASERRISSPERIGLTNSARHANSS